MKNTCIPEGWCIMEIILPPIQGTTLRDQSPLFNSIGVLESSIPLCLKTSCSSGICLTLSAFNNLYSKKQHGQQQTCRIHALENKCISDKQYWGSIEPYEKKGSRS